MKGYILLLLTLCITSFSLSAQDNKIIADSSKTDTLKPYQKFPELPAFNILETDSSTIFNTFNIPYGKPTALMLFSPDCKHCKRTIDALLKGMDSISNIQFYLVTGSHSMTEIKNFYKEHHLENYKNIQLVGRDYEFFYFNYYVTKFVPDIALYDEHKKLMKLIEGETRPTVLYNLIHGSK